jgi:hypothetical protein
MHATVWLMEENVEDTLHNAVGFSDFAANFEFGVKK